MKHTRVLAAVVAIAASLAVTPSLLAQISLGTASSFAVLGGSAVTNTGATAVTGNVGVSPGTSIGGFPPGTVAGGSLHSADATASQAQTDLTTAYNAAAGTPCNVDLTGQDLGGLTLTTGVYCYSSSAGLTGNLTLDFQGNPNALFIFKIGSTLTTASGSRVLLINNGGGSCPANLYWQVGTSATLGTTTRFICNILAGASITMTTSAQLAGRALARSGAVTLDTNNMSITSCGPVIACPVITVSPTTLPNGSVGVPYTPTITASGGSGTYTFAVTSGSLPPGVVLSTAGVMSGSPTTGGTYTFSITATDTSTGCLGSRAYSINIASALGCPVITVNPTTLPAGIFGIPYSQTISSTGGAGAPVFSISSGALPHGLHLNPSTGVISGTPDTAGIFAFTIRSTDINGCFGSRAYSVAIPPPTGAAGGPTLGPAGLAVLMVLLVAAGLFVMNRLSL